MSDNAMANKAAGNETDRPPETTTLSDDELRGVVGGIEDPAVFSGTSSGPDWSSGNNNENGNNGNNNGNE